MQPVATEVPFTIVGNEVEIVTMLCSPVDLKALTCGFLFASGLIRSGAELLDYSLDETRWLAHATLARDPDPSIMDRRVYTSGCGKGVMYSNVVELSSRRPVASALRLDLAQVAAAAAWLQKGSALYRDTGGVHSVALVDPGSGAVVTMDDVGRHNAVDKVVGWGLLSGADFGDLVLVTTGRVSSEIVHKAVRAGIGVVISRGAPTHQALLRAAESGVTVVGFARGRGCTIYSHPERIGIA